MKRGRKSVSPFPPATNLISSPPPAATWGMKQGREWNKDAIGFSVPTGCQPDRLAAAGRNPADITIPIQGSEAGGDEGDDVELAAAQSNGSAASPTSAAMPAGSTTASTAAEPAGSADSAGSRRCPAHTARDRGQVLRHDGPRRRSGGRQS